MSGFSPSQIRGTHQAIISQKAHSTSAVQTKTKMVTTIFPSTENPRLNHKNGKPRAAVTKKSRARTSQGLSTRRRHAICVGGWLFVTAESVVSHVGLFAIP